jgi:intracellular multiplication protein IcmO
MLTIHAQPNPRAYNFSDLAVLFSDYAEMERLFRNIPRDHPDREVVWSFLKQFHGTDRNGDPVVDTKRYAEWLTGLNVKMLDFSHSEYRRILNDYSPDIELKSAIMRNKIIVVVIPALSDKEGVTIFGKLFLADLARAVGQIQSDRLKPALPFFCFLDEYPSFADESHTELWQQARSANISLWPAIQGKGFMDRVAPFFGDNLATNNWHQFYFDIRDPRTREFATKLAGTTIRKFRSTSDSESFGYSRENTKTGAIRNESLGKGKSSSVREQREDLLQPDDFVMDPGNAIFVAKRGTYRVVLPIVEFASRIPTLDEIALPRFEKPNVQGLNLMRDRQRRTDNARA